MSFTAGVKFQCGDFAEDSKVQALIDNAEFVHNRTRIKCFSSGFASITFNSGNAINIPQIANFPDFYDGSNLNRISIPNGWRFAKVFASFSRIQFATAGTAQGARFTLNGAAINGCPEWRSHWGERLTLKSPWIAIPLSGTNYFQFLSEVECDGVIACILKSFES